MNARISTYRAYFEADGGDIYSGERHGNLVGLLPAGAWPTDGGTMDRTDGGDPFERARFITPSGRVIIVMREPFVACRCAVVAKYTAFACAENAYAFKGHGRMSTICVRCVSGRCKGRHGIKAGTKLADGSVSQ